MGSKKTTLITRETFFEEIEGHILPYHVSLGGSPGKSNLTFPTPIGSGTFTKFSVQDDIVYGILTAAHVAKALRFGEDDNRKFIGLSKPYKGDTIACSVTFHSIYYDVASVERFHSTSKDGYRPDIAFITLGINERLSCHELIENSSFYDLDGNQELELSNPQILSAFFKGAGKIRSDGFLNTFTAIGGGEILKFDEKHDVQYWQIPNTTGESIAGGSGAGFWRFIYEKNFLQKSLEGVINAESQNYSSIEAIASSYLYGVFLSELKKNIKILSNSLSCFQTVQL